MTKNKRRQQATLEEQAGSLEISMSCTLEEMDRATRFMELLKDPRSQDIIYLIDILMECPEEDIEKSLQILERLKNPKYEELFNNILQISDSQRLEALICWSNQYKDGGKSHE